MKCKYVLAVLLAVCMVVAVFSGCGGNTAPAPEEESAAASVISTSEEEEAPDAAPAEEETEPETASTEESALEEGSDIEEPPADDGSIPGRSETVELPVVEEPVTITAFQTVSFAVASFMEDLNENLTAQKLQELTNVHFEFTNTSNDAAETNFQLMIAGGDYTDIIEAGDNRYADGADAAIEADIYVDLLPEFCPNYTAIVEYYDLQADCTTDSGRYAAIYRLYSDVQASTYGPFIRADYLEQVGKEIPVTYDDYEDVLLAFKNELGLSEPLGLGGAGIPNGNYLVAGFDVYGYTQMIPKVIAPYMQKDGEVLYGAATPEFKEYLTMMHSWYEEGIIGSDFISNHPMFYNSDGVIAGDIGLFYTNADDAQSLIAANEGIKLAPVPDPVKQEGDMLHVGGSQVHGAFTDGGYVITSAATEEKIEAYLKYENFLFSEEGSVIADYGVEGVTFEYQEDGTPWPTDLILNNPDGLTQQQAKAYYIFGVGLSDPLKPYEKASYAEEIANAADTWTANRDYAYYFPEALSVPTDQAYEYNGMYNDISTYVSEMTLKFITGDESLDGYDDYIAQLEAMGLPTCVSIMQDAYDSYISK